MLGPRRAEPREEPVIPASVCVEDAVLGRVDELEMHRLRLPERDAAPCSRTEQAGIEHREERADAQSQDDRTDADRPGAGPRNGHAPEIESGANRAGVPPVPPPGWRVPE